MLRASQTVWQKSNIHVNFVASRIETPRIISDEHAEPIFKLTISTSMYFKILKIDIVRCGAA